MQLIMDYSHLVHNVRVRKFHEKYLMEQIRSVGVLCP